MKTCRADFLFASPSPVAGVARFFDFAGAYDCYNASATESEADSKAVYLDWYCVGNAFRDALRKALEEKNR